jgi:hypothetical protein
MDYGRIMGWVEWRDKHRFDGVKDLRSDTRKELVSQCELFEFNANPPAVGERYGVYIKRATSTVDGKQVAKIGPGVATTWMGEVFGTVKFGSSHTRWGKWGQIILTDLRVYINDMEFRGRWSESEMDCCNIRRIK